MIALGLLKRIHYSSWAVLKFQVGYRYCGDDLP